MSIYATKEEIEYTVVEVLDKYEVAKSKGCNSSWNVVSIKIPKSQYDKYHKLEFYGTSAITHIKHRFSNSEIIFSDADDIQITFNIVVTV